MFVERRYSEESGDVSRGYGGNGSDVVLYPARRIQEAKNASTRQYHLYVLAIKSQASNGCYDLGLLALYVPVR